MANPAHRLAENVDGDFFVDATCIDCDTCRQIAPHTYRDHGGQSSVYAQPAMPEDEQLALMALVACPTGSIGARGHDARAGVGAFPSLVDENVYFCGFTAESSFGAWSYLLVRPESAGGNVLIDSPRKAPSLLRKIAEMGGAPTMFLTHRDDIADHAYYAAGLGARRIMHADDGAARLGIEQVIDEDVPVQLDDDLIAIPVPGHTRGQMVLLYREKYLFTGDHLAWSPRRNTLTAFPDACWYSWRVQTESMRRLLDYRFEWVLPGHGRIHGDTAEAMHRYLVACIAWMELRDG